jgi:DNA-binding SARP family transcriptional activator
MEQLRLLTFGGLALFVGGTSMTGPVTSRQRLALLALLAVARERGLNRDKIQLYLWPDSDAKRARQGLNQVLYFQRRQLGGEAEGIFLGRKTLRLNPKLMTSDVWEFQDAIDAGKAEAAVRLYVGPFLDGFFLKGSPEFEQWVAEQRRRFESQCAKAVGQLAAAAAARGDQRQALEWWRRAVELNPFDTETVLQLAGTWVALGDRAAAVRCAQDYEESLRRELALPPDPRITRLIADLRGGAT